MAQFRGTVEGNRGMASRIGHKTSGLIGVINGWHAGVKVIAYYDDEINEDVFDIYATGGSRGDTKQRIATVHRDESVTIYKNEKTLREKLRKDASEKRIETVLLRGD